MPKENKKTESEKFKEDILKLLGQNPQDTEKLQCETNYSIDQAVGQTTLRMNCEGCSHKSSFSDASCRKQVISKLVENPADRVEFARRLTTDEYEKDDVELLR